MSNYPRKYHALTPFDFFRGALSFNDMFEKGWLTDTGGIRSDLKETDTAFVLEAEMPGFKKENISVEWSDGRLMVAAKQEEEKKEEKENYLKRERFYGEVSRRYRVEGIKENEITAEYKDGVLKVNMPKAEPTTNAKAKINID